MENSGDIQVYNPDKQISEQVTLKNIVAHDVAMNLARTGVPELPSEKPLTLNQRMMMRFKGLNEVISSQQCMVTNIKPIVGHNSRNKWGKGKSEEDKIKTPFEDQDNDYNELNGILVFLDHCEQRIIKARQTRKPDDDFVIETQNDNGNTILELTKNFFEMIKELEVSYEVAYGIMLMNKIVSSGITFDEELEDKQKEEEARRRIVES